jgi:hypothetical protein
VLLLSALFIHLFAQQALVRGGSSHTATATVAATSAPLASVAPTKPIVVPQPNWQTRTAPESVFPPMGGQLYDNGFAFSPTDAQTAYICTTTNATDAPFTIWASHDGARTWTHVSDIPYAGKVADCSVVVDATDPLRVNMTLSAQNPGGQMLARSYISDDGAKTWRTLSDDMHLIGLSTRGNVSVAVAAPWGFPTKPGAKTRPWHLSVSRDDWGAWQPIDGALTAQGMMIERVWQRPADGALLALAEAPATPVTPSTTNGLDGYKANVSLWQSGDLGAHWTPLPTPPNLNFTAAVTVTVAQPQGNAAWRVCGFDIMGEGSNQSEIIGCTLDGGQTWTSRPLPNVVANCGNDCTHIELVNLANMLPDGSLVATFTIGPTTNGIIQSTNWPDLFRLGPQASQWQDLGMQPGNAVVTIGSGTTGTVVCFSGALSMDGPSGTLVDHYGGDIPNPGGLAIATLP